MPSLLAEVCWSFWYIYVHGYFCFFHVGEQVRKAWKWCSTVFNQHRVIKIGWFSVVKAFFLKISVFYVSRFIEVLIVILICNSFRSCLWMRFSCNKSLLYGITWVHVNWGRSKFTTRLSWFIYWVIVILLHGYIFSSLLSYWLLVFCAFYLLIPRMETLSFGKMITHVIIA